MVGFGLFLCILILSMATTWENEINTCFAEAANTKILNVF
jgi:hypothetical protein